MGSKLYYRKAGKRKDRRVKRERKNRGVRAGHDHWKEGKRMWREQDCRARDKGELGQEKGERELGEAKHPLL